MRRYQRRKLGGRLIVGCAASSLFALTIAATAQMLEPDGSATATPNSRTVAQMQADEAVMLKPAAVQPVPFRPTVDEASYAAYKAEIDQLSPLASSVRPAAPKPLYPVVPALIGVTVKEGVNSTTAGGWRPPDAEGVVGDYHYIQTVNNRIVIYNRTGPTAVLNVSLNSFFGYATQSYFDARVIYDRKWRRWIVAAPAFTETTSPYVQRYSIAISKGYNPVYSGWWIYHLNVNYGASSNFVFDFPQIGLDNDALLVTANIFDPGYVSSRLSVLAKSWIYNGLGGTYWYWGGLHGTLASTLAYDQNRKTFLAAAEPNDNKIYVYTLEHSGRIPPALSGPSTVSETAYTVPPNAAQPGTAATLDTLDNRFQNVSSQIGDDLWNIHSIAIGPAAIRWYRINTVGMTNAQTGSFYSSVSSADFNPSIAANGSYAFVCWSSTDSNNLVNAQIRWSGKLDSETVINAPAWATLFTSPTYYGTSGVQRWGDYSAISLDPSWPKAAWMVNEKINSTTTWGTRFGAVTFP